MKKILLISAILMANVVTFAQEVAPFYHTFEEEGSGDLWLSQDKNSIIAECIGNPLKEGINTSDVALKLEKYDAQWPGVQYTLNTPLNFGPAEDVQYAFVHLKLYNPQDTELRFKFYDSEKVEYVYDKPIDANSAWQEYKFFVGECASFSGVPINIDITKIAIIPRKAGTIYIDDVTVSKTGNVQIPTGIKAIDNEPLTMVDVFDLQGRRLNTTPARKGIYIVNGKKVVL